MVRARFCASLLGLGLMLAARSTDARELAFFVENRLGADSNVFRRAEETQVDEIKPKAGMVWEITPRITLRDNRDEHGYEFRYQPTYERFFAVEDGGGGEDFSGVDHVASANYLWRMNPATSVGITGRLDRQRRIREGFLDQGFVADPPIERTDNDYIQALVGSLFLNHALSPQLSIQASYRFDDLDVSRQDSSDSRANTVSGGIFYGLTEYTRAGVRATYRQRATKASVDPDGNPNTGPPNDPTLGLREFRSETDTFDISFSVSQQVTPRLAVDVGFGPSFFNTRDEDSLGNVSYSGDGSFFASAGVMRDWRRGTAEVRYTRSEGGGAGATSAASILDRVTAALYWNPARNWGVRVRGSFIHRVSVASDAFFGRDTRNDFYSAGASVERRLTEEVWVIASFRYSWSRLDGYTPFVPVLGGFLTDFETSSTTETIEGFVALRYAFDPYVF